MIDFCKNEGIDDCNYAEREPCDCRGCLKEEIEKLIADNDLLGLENSQLIDDNVYLEDKARGAIGCNNKDYDGHDNCNYVEYVECDCPVCLKEELNEFREKNNELEKENDLLERQQYHSINENVYLEERLSKETALHKKVAADEINKNALLKADVRRLEKLSKNLADDNMRLRFPVKECLDEGTIPLVPKLSQGIRFDNEMSDEEIRQRDDLTRRMHAERSDRVIKAAIERMGEINDPWKELLSKCKFFEALDYSKLVEELDIDEGHVVSFEREFNITGGSFIHVTFTSKEYGGSWTIPSKHIPTMAGLKNIYGDFKEICG